MSGTSEIGNLRKKLHSGVDGLGLGDNAKAAPAGELIARGSSPEEAADRIGTVEGLTTAPVLRDLSRRLGIELPITEGVCQVLDGEDLHDLAANLMGRQPTRE